MLSTDEKLAKIVVVEDDYSMQRILHHSLHKTFSITIFNSGFDAMAFLQKGNRPDIIVTDLNTPGLSGLDLIGQLKSSGFFNRIQIVVLSSEISTDLRIRHLEAGADDYLLKPFNPRELEVRLKVLLRRTGKISID